MKEIAYKKWGIETNLKPFGTQEPFVKPFGSPNNNCHWKSSSPMTSPPSKEGSKISKKMKGGWL